MIRGSLVGFAAPSASSPGGPTMRSCCDILSWGDEREHDCRTRLGEAASSLVSIALACALFFWLGRQSMMNPGRHCKLSLDRNV